MDQQNKLPDTQNSGSDTIFFPAIETTTDEENEYINRLINTPPAREAESTEGEEIVDFAEDDAIAQPDPSFAIENADAPKSKSPRTIPDFNGIVPSLREKYADSSAKKGFAVFTATLLLSVFIILTLCLTICAYVASVALLLLTSLLLLVLCVGLVCLGLAGLSYGIILLFTHGILVALIEIGLSLVSFGLILALSALSGELATNQLPRLIRFLSRQFAYAIRYLFSYIYGSKKFASKKIGTEVAK